VRLATLSSIAACLLAVPAAFAAPPDAAANEFFEKKIRPVLMESCYSCHSAEAASKKKLKGGLRLDSKASALTGGDSGPALAPSKPGESLLLKSLKYDGDLKMPPKGKLPDAVIADFEKWIKDGAADPRVEVNQAPPKQVGLSIEAGRKFWSFKPVINPAVPTVKDQQWPANTIDRFILAALEAKGLAPSKEADRATLARRVSYDLTGLPPTPEDVDKFANDADPKAYEKMVDRLLASPAFGERWGRHWLDLARYADSVTLRGFVFKEAWRYRDYAIESFNRDVPFDRFIKEQIAGDLLPAATPADKARQVIATSYLMLGNTNLEEQDKKQLRMDVVDEQLDVISKGLLAQTITCARCHDHKFDPIPTKDYYALAGILRNVKSLENSNVSMWIEVPLPAEPEVEAAVKKHTAELADLQNRIKSLKAKTPPVNPETSSKGIVAIKDVPGIVVDDTAATKIGDWMESTHSNNYIGTGYVHDKDQGKGEKSITFDPAIPTTGKYEVWLAYSGGTSRSEKVTVTVFSADGEKEVPVNMKLAPPIQGRFVSLGQYRFEKDGQSFVIISNEGTKGHVTADAIAFIPVDQVPVPGVTVKPAAGEKPQAVDALTTLEAQLKALQAKAPKRPMAMSVVEEKTIEDAKVHVRGSVNNQAELAPRGVLQVATLGTAPTIPADQSGRVQLAEWIASKENPLTARVFANRVWYWLLGDGIVRTLDNFGTTGESPSNPELLDHLATSFVEHGWSVKALVREVVLSRTYRQSALRTPNSALEQDPENRLFGRANRRRLDAESIRDTVLVVSGKLVPSEGGMTFSPSVAADYSYKHTALTRSVYMPVFRNSLPDLFEAFDFADTSMVNGKRNTSTVAPQALFMMNNPFVVDQAKAAAERLIAEKLPSDDVRITRLYRLSVGREPTAGERTVAAKFLADRSGDPKLAWATLFQAVFASADFRYLE